MPATISQLKNELSNLPPEELIRLCIRLAKYKKDNKELLSYLLIQAGDEEGFIKSVKQEIDSSFSQMNRSNNYYIKKTIRKILRLVNKYIRYSGLPQTEAELLIYFCTKIKQHKINVQANNTLNNLYQNQMRRIKKAISSLHEDLQYDLNKEMNEFEL